MGYRESSSHTCPLRGRDATCTEVWARAHQQSLSRGDAARAARWVFCLGFVLLNQGEHAPRSGWIARARRLLDVVQTLDRTHKDLRRLEGDARFEGQQRFFAVAARLAAERCLSRFAFHAVRR